MLEVLSERIPFHHAAASGCWLPIPARRGGDRMFCSGRFAIFSVAACAVPTRASVVKVIQRSCGAKLQKLQGLVHSPPSPPTPLHPRRGDQGSSTTIFGQRFVWGGVHVQRANIQTCREPREIGTTLILPVFTLKVGQSTLNSTPLKTRPHMAVKGHFECWRFPLNSPPCTRGHIRLLAPLSRPAGRERGWG